MLAERLLKEGRITTTSAANPEKQLKVYSWSDNKFSLTQMT